jgi:hypothetical protein
VNIRSIYDRISEGSPTADRPILDHKKDDCFFDTLQMKSKEFVINKGKGKFQKVHMKKPKSKSQDRTTKKTRKLFDTFFDKEKIDQIDKLNHVYRDRTTGIPTVDMFRSHATSLEEAPTPIERRSMSSMVTSPQT